MPRSPIYTSAPWTLTFSEVIDVRSPSEFAEDHWPGAINLPVLDDAQRAEVGTLYKQVNPFTARRLGAALITENISVHLKQHFNAKDRSYHPLVYCWRGGQRSESLAHVLAQIGWAVTVIEGGYKTYRTWVRQQLEALALQFCFRILGGPTGVGKTFILQRLAAAGAQIIDLENLANHRGSLLGQEEQMTQPSQKYFETLLLHHLQRLDPAKPVWAESESSKIGEIYVPSALCQQLRQAKGVEIQLPVAQRVNWLLQSYPYWLQAPARLKEKLTLLKRSHGQAQLMTWFDWIDQQLWPDLVADLLQKHYDPAYQHSLQRDFSQIHQVMTLPDLSEASVDVAVKQLLEWGSI